MSTVIPRAMIKQAQQEVSTEMRETMNNRVTDDGGAFAGILTGIAISLFLSVCVIVALRHLFAVSIY